MDKVKETLQKILATIRDRWGALSKTVRIVIPAVAAAAVVALIVVIVITNRIEYIQLFTGMSAAETQSVNSALGTMGLADGAVKFDGNNILVDKRQEANIRMQLAVLGYPKTTFSYNVWDDSIGMFSTDKEKEVKQIHQLQDNVMAALNSFPQVNSSMVIFTPAEKTSNVISTGNKTEAAATVVVHLNSGMTSAEIDGIYNIILTSLPGLERKNITLTDGSGVMLLPEDGLTAAEDLALMQQRFQMKKEFEDAFAATAKESLEEMLGPFVRTFSVSASAELDYGDWTQTEKIYTPSVPEEGTSGGMISNEVDQVGYGGITAEGGPVGTVIDADNSPDYPTLVADAGTDVYYEKLHQVERKINEVIREYHSSDYTLKRLTASVMIDGTELTDRELQQWREIVADAIGASVDDVSVKAVPMILSSPDPGDIVINPQQDRDFLIFIIIALGVVLIILFLLAIMTSGSKKKRQVRSRLAPAGAVPDSGVGVTINGDEIFGTAVAPRVDPNTGIALGPGEGGSGGIPGLASLLPEDGSESREGALKREIREFAAENPDIVAQLIRTWMTS